MRTVLLMQCLTEINDMGDQRRVPVSDKCLREVGRVSESESESESKSERYFPFQFHTDIRNPTL